MKYGLTPSDYRGQESLDLTVWVLFLSQWDSWFTLLYGFILEMLTMWIFHCVHRTTIVTMKMYHDIPFATFVEW